MDAGLLIVTFGIGVVIGGVLGALIAYLYTSSQVARLEAEKAVDAERLSWLSRAQQDMQKIFGALAFKTLKKSTEVFAGQIHQQLKQHADHIGSIRTSFETNLSHLDQRIRKNTDDASHQIAERLKTHSEHLRNTAEAAGTFVSERLKGHAEQIGTLKAALQKEIESLDGHVRQMEITRAGAYESLGKQLSGLEQAHGELRTATQQLNSALRVGTIRGRWGEFQLRRVVELAGMLEHVSFEEQQTGTDSGRPDMTVRLPNHGQVLIDSKCPLQHYLDAIAAGDDVERRNECLASHSKGIRQKIVELSDKKYWEQFECATELVVMFVPIESCLVTAFEHDPDLIEFAATRRVVLATPLTLLAFLRAIAYGWQQFTMSKNAQQILGHGKELYKRTMTWLDHLRTVGKKIDDVVEAYNKSVASLQTRFIPSARRFQELSAIPEVIEDLAAVTRGVSVSPSNDTSESEPQDGQSTALTPSE